MKKLVIGISAQLTNGQAAAIKAAVEAEIGMEVVICAPVASMLVIDVPDDLEGEALG